MTLARNSYTPGHFELNIDGHKSTAFLKSVDGGWTRANISDESVGSEQWKQKHVSTADGERFRPRGRQRHAGLDQELGGPQVQPPQRRDHPRELQSAADLPARVPRGAD